MAMQNDNGSLVRISRLRVSRPGALLCGLDTLLSELQQHQRGFRTSPLVELPLRSSKQDFGVLPFKLPARSRGNSFHEGAIL
jgi:hypothetical protein